uniref:E3 SUMO-protein ligase RanBP2 n=1 Tax=Timema bartmani TaxID=61472 RepID=A0A7R9F019_9NEOP|nr:unnamed protein product [Timema bartmani]
MRYMRYYQVAKLYYNIKEWEIARRYVSNYLSVHEGSAEAHKLLGQVYDRQGQKKQALEQFKCSLELNAKQVDLVLRVCELLVEVDDPVNADRARYWCERAEATHPHHPVVFKLKEHLLTASGKQDLTDLEGLIAGNKSNRSVRTAGGQSADIGLTVFSQGPGRLIAEAEIVHRPNDVSLRIRLLKLYLDNDKVEDAYNHASEIEGRYLFRDESGWYTCLVQVCQAYESSNGSKDLKFYLLYVSVLERAVALCLEEHTTIVCRSVSDSVQALFRLDQMLEKACQFNPLPSERELYHEFLKHMRAQLCFHLAEFLLKKANKEQSNWKEAIRSAAPLLLHSLVAPVDTQALWLLNLAQGHKKAANKWRLEAAHRYSQAGHVLLGLSSDHHNHFLERVAQFCSFSWRERLYQRIFVLREHQQLITTSQFVSHPQLADPPLRLPSLTELQPYDEQSQLLHPSSLHHLVWLGLQYLSPMRVSGGSMRSDFSCRVMEDLQLICPNLNNCTTETLTKLDVDAFLYASAFCAGATLEEQLRAGLWGSDRPPTLPVSITQQLCTGPQAKWWSAVHQIYMRQTSGDNAGELRLTIQRGLEVIRVNGNHGLDVKLLVLLARANALSAQTEVVGEVPALEARAALYWNCCIPLLEKLQRNQAIRPPSTKLFDFQCKELTPAELSAVVEEGRLFLACQLMNSNKLEQACETFNQLKSPYASFYQASVYRRLADEELGNQSGEMITSEMRSRHIVMLTKARDALYLTLDRLRSPSMDQNHPLNAELIEHIDDVERRLNRIDPEMFNDVNLNDLDGLDAESLPSMASAGDNFHFNLPSSSMNLTPRVARNGVNPRTGFRPTHGHRLNNSNILRDLNATYRTEARPSPERLQHARESGAMATFLEQSKRTMDELKGIRDELKVIRDDQKGISLRMEALENVLHMDELKKEIQEIHREMKNRRGTLSSQLNVELAQVYGEEGLSVFDEEDYGDDLVSGRPMGAAATYAAFRPTGYTPMLFPQGEPQPPPPLMPPFFPQVYQPYYNPTAAGLPFSEGQQLPDFRTPQFPPPMVVPPPVNVVITTSDTLPTSTPTNLPTLSVTIPPQHRQPLKQQQQQQQMQPSVPHNFQISMPPQAQLPLAAVLERDAAALSPVIPLSTQQLLSNVPLPRYSAVTSPATNKSVTDTSTNRLSRPSASEDEGAEEDEHDPSFEPLIPLPAEVDLTTGEEGETLLFEQRAKLFRFVDKEWKERGVGQIKILFNAVSGKSRVLMRREQVLKICANHLLQADMDLAPMKNRAWMWVANDFADEEVRLEKLCVRFKTADEAQNFKEAFDKAKIMSANATPTQITSTTNATSIQATTANATPAQITTTATSTQPTSTTATSTQATTVNAAPAQITTVNATSAQPTATNVTSTQPTATNVTSTQPTATNVTSTQPTATNVTSTQPTATNVTSTQPTATNATLTQPTATNATLTQSTTTTGTINTFSVGGLKFFSNPKTPQEPIPSPIKEAPSKPKEKPNPFAGFSFTSTPKKSENEVPSKSVQEDQPLMFDTPVTATTFSTLAQQAKQPAFKKDDSFSGWQGTGTPVFGGAAARTTPGGEERVDDYESTAEFQPVIPLPDLVEVKTGEEGQEVLFQERAKLLRFDSDGKQWKERGVGQMKVLKEPGTGRVRLLMRREQVLKVCCNHYLSPGLELKPLSSSDRAWSWCAQDFSEGELRVETLAIKFKTQEQAHEFKRLIDKVQGEMASCTASPHQGPPAWKCPDCMFPNADDASHCRSCKKRLPRSGAESPKLAVPLNPNRLPKLTEVIRPKEGSWECGTCYLINEGSDIRCVACDSVKPTKGSRSPGATLPDVAGKYDYQWVCSSCQFTNCANQDSCTSCIAANPSKSVGVSKVPIDTRPLSELFKPKSGSWECKQCYVRNSDDSAATCIACSSPNPNAPEQLTSTTEKPATPFTYGLSGFTLGTTQQSGFNLGAPSEASMQFSFGIVPTPAASASSNPAATPGTGPATQSLLEPEKSGAKESTEADHSFIFGSQSQFNFNFTGVRPKSPGKTPRSPKSPGGGLGLSEGEDSLNDEGVDDGEGEHIYFQPVIPLPDKVPVITGEEDEEVVYCHRAKLFRFVASEWKERGVGDFKILRHPDTCKIRLVMRRDQVLKLCLNHFLTPEISFTAKGDKAWMWYAPDFAEGQVTNECFVLRFKTSEIADQFKEAVSKSQEELSNKTVSPPKRQEPSGSSLDKGDGIYEPHSHLNASALDATTTTFQGQSSTGHTALPVQLAAGDGCNASHVNVDVMAVLTELGQAMRSPLVDEPDNSCTSIPPDNVTSPKISTLNSLCFGAQLDLCAHTLSEEVQSPCLDLDTLHRLGSFCYNSGNCSLASFQTSEDSDIVPLDDDDDVNPFVGLSDVQHTIIHCVHQLFECSLHAAPCDFLIRNYDENCSSRCCNYLPEICKECCNRATSPCRAAGHFLCLALRPPTPPPIPLTHMLSSFLVIFYPYCNCVPVLWLYHSLVGGPLAGRAARLMYRRFGVQCFMFQLRRLEQFIVISYALVVEGIFHICTCLPRDLINVCKTAETYLNKPHSPSIGVGSCSSAENKRPDLHLEQSDGNSVSPAMASFSFSLPESGFSLSGRLPDNSPQSKDEVEVVGEVVATKEEQAAAELLMLPPNFYLYRLKPPCPGCPGCEQDSSDSDTESASRVTHSEQKRGVESLTETSVCSPLVPPQKPAASATSFNLNISTAPAANVASNLDTSNLGSASKPSSSYIFGNNNQSMTDSIFGGRLQMSKPPLWNTTRAEPESTNTQVVTTNTAQIGFKTSTSAILGSENTTSPIFGGKKTTAGSIFGGGSPTTTGTVFGRGSTTTASSIFGGVSTTTASSIFGGVSTTTASSIFGGVSTTTTSSIFGGGSTTTAGSVFGGGSTPTAGSIFGGGNTPNVGSIFGGGNTTTTSSIFTGTNTTTSSIFGGTFQTMPTTSSFSFQPSASKGSIFDKALGTSFGAPALFGAKDSKPVSMFGGQTTLIAVKSPPDQVKEQNLAPLLPVDNSLTFARLATQEPAAFSEGDKNFLWQGAGTKVFGGSVAANTSHSSDDGDADSSVVNHDPHFEPIIALPDAIEVCTGEEQEEKMFCQRAKLYRYDASTKEWKERGVGEMKILHHPTNHTFRLLLRREQVSLELSPPPRNEWLFEVHKVVCNHLITADLDLKPLATSDKAWCWGALNYTEEGEGRLEELAVRFKLSDTAQDFKERIEDIRTILLVQQTETLEVTEVTEDNESEEVSYSRRSTYTVEEVEGEPLVWNPSNEEEDLEYEEDAEKTLMFEKRATLLVRDPSTQQWDTQGPGDLQVIYDPDIFAARIYFECDRSGEQRCNTVIATNTSLEVDKKDCTWCSVDNSQDTPAQKTFMARFSSVEAAQEFESVFHEGLSMAEQSEIMEHCIPYSSANDDDDDDDDDVDDDREQ